MRMPEKDEDIINKVCVCSIGRPAIVTGSNYKLPIDAYKKDFYVGIGLDGKGLWASSKPCIIAENIKEYYDRVKGYTDVEKML